MGTSVRPLPSSSTVVRDREENTTPQWRNLVLRKRRSRPSTSPSTSTILRVTAMSTPSTLVTLCAAAKESKDQGGFHDFVEILKLYDKNDDNTMIGNELFRLLTNLGEKLNKQEAKDLMKELCEPE